MELGGNEFMNLNEGQRAQRKELITVAEWSEGTGTGATTHKEIIGVRTEDSSIEFNPDIETITDILGITYTDVNKTEPQQSFDPHYVIGGSDLDEYLSRAALKNDIDAFNGVFDIYIIAAFIVDGTPTTTDGKYYAVKHEGCTILPTSIGGSNYTSMPLEVHFSNKITEGTVNKLDDSFTFTPASE